MGQILICKLNAFYRKILLFILLIGNLVSGISVTTLLSINIYVFFYFNTKSHLFSNLSFGTFTIINILVVLIISFIQTCLCIVLNISRSDERVKKLVKKSYFHSLLYTYLLSSLVIIPAMLIYTMYFSNTMFYEFAKGLLVKMDAYFTDLIDKDIFDELQLSYQCCGAHDYKDWAKIMTTKTINTVPFSCCKFKYLDFCLNDDIKGLRVHSINSRGCAHRIEEFISFQFDIITSLWLSLFIVHIVTLIGFQYWKTSTEWAINVKGGPKRSGRGWLVVPFIGLYRDLRNVYEKDKQRRDERRTLLNKRSEQTLPDNTFPNEEMSINANKWKFENIESLPPPNTMDMPEAPEQSPRLPNYDFCPDCDEFLTIDKERHICAKAKGLVAIHGSQSSDDNTSDKTYLSSDDESLFDIKNDWLANRDTVNYNKDNNTDKGGGGGGSAGANGGGKMQTNEIKTEEDNEKDEKQLPKRQFRERYFILKEIR